MLPRNFPPLKANQLQPALLALEKSNLSRYLAPYTPVLAGTIPLGLEQAGSDLDICCTMPDPQGWKPLLSCLRNYPDFQLIEKKFSSGPARLVRLQLGPWPVEIVFQAMPVYRQTAVRHLWIEAQLLHQHGLPLQHKIKKVRSLGYKTEAAFAKVLGLSGDPYQALLTLEPEFDPICVS